MSIGFGRVTIEFVMKLMIIIRSFDSCNANTAEKFIELIKLEKLELTERVRTKCQIGDR
jgi:hypothetical protein